MSNAITILDLPRRRSWLERGMGAKVRDLFGRDRTRPLPTVEFVTPAEARARKLPATSWYRFDSERIGIYLEPIPDAAREWERLEHHTLHELLHWTWNFSATSVLSAFSVSNGSGRSVSGSARTSSFTRSDSASSRAMRQTRTASSAV